MITTVLIQYLSWPYCSLSARCQLSMSTVLPECAFWTINIASFLSDIDKFVLAGPSLPTASEFGKRNVLAFTWSSFLTSASVIPGQETARRKLPFQPTHSCQKETLVGAKLSQKRGSGKSLPCSFQWRKAFFNELYAHGTCYEQFRVWHWLPDTSQTGLSGPGRDLRGRGKIFVKGEAGKVLDWILWAMAFGDTPRGSCPTGKACVRQLCTQEQGAAHIRQSGVVPSAARPCQPLHFRQVGSGRLQEGSDSSLRQPHATASH